MAVDMAVDMAGALLKTTSHATVTSSQEVRRGGMLASELAAALGGRIVGDGGARIVRGVPPAEACGLGDLAIAVSQEAARQIAGSRARWSPCARASRSKAIDSAPSSFFHGPVPHSPRYCKSAAPDQFRAGYSPECGRPSSGANRPKGSHWPSGCRRARRCRWRGDRDSRHVTLSEGVVIGWDCLIHAGVRIGWGCRIADRVTIHHMRQLVPTGSDTSLSGPGPSRHSRKAAPRQRMRTSATGCRRYTRYRSWTSAMTSRSER